MFGKNAPDMFVREVYNSGTQNISTGTLQLAPVKCNAYGHINGIMVSVGTTLTVGTGTVNTSNNIIQVVNHLTIRDKASKPILDCTGAQLRKVQKVLSLRDGYNWGTLRKGQYTAPTALASVATLQTETFELPFSVIVQDQPITVELTLDVLATLFSTVGTATATAIVKFASQNIQVPVPGAETQRLYTVTAANAITSETDYAFVLPRTVTIDIVAIDLTADANLTDMTIKPKGGNVGVDRLNQVYWNMFDTFNMTSGHLAGFFFPIIAPFVVNDSTIFSVNPAASVTPVFYITHRGVR